MTFLRLSLGITLTAVCVNACLAYDESLPEQPPAPEADELDHPQSCDSCELTMGGDTCTTGKCCMTNGDCTTPCPGPFCTLQCVAQGVNHCGCSGTVCPSCTRGLIRACLDGSCACVPGP